MPQKHGRNRRKRSSNWPRSSVNVEEAGSGHVRCKPNASDRSPFAVTILAVSSLLAVACDREPARAPPEAQESAASAPALDPLPSWNDTSTKRAILDFVDRVTDEGSTEFVPADERIATFDNDGTLWSEQPVYNQLAFAFDRVHALAPQHPEWREQQPFKGVLDGDLESVAASGEPGLVRLMMATHVGNTTDEFAGVVSDWISSSRHPRFDRPYTDMVYKPMLELLAMLRDRGFETYMVSGGGVEFMRPWAEGVYGIPPEQVIGSRVRVEYQLRDGEPVLLRLPDAEHVDDGPGKPVGIEQQIGRRPVAAFGNSDGDFEMLEWTTSAPGLRLGMIVHHTDAEREWAYDRGSRVGALERALDEAPAHGWLVVDMKRDWNTIFPFEGR
jgi:phosphoglycolate phosphatase-like HAD superfamily hydrolase